MKTLKKESKPSQVPALDSTIKILELLATQGYQHAKLTKISEATDINVSTCLRILRTLEEKSYVTFSSNSKEYSLGTPLIALGNRAREVNDYIEVASAYLKDLTKTGSSFVLVKRVRNSRLMYVAKEEPDLKVRLTVSAGDSFPITAGALGKCFYAYLDEEDAQNVLDEVMSDDHLTRYTEKSVTTKQDLDKQIPKIREEGIAESHEEYSLGISAYACPIFDSKGKIILGLGTYIPTSLINQIKTEDIKEMMKTAAAEITEAINTLV
ncbi:IclR family transcriptional regulator [Sporosarcina sp. P13]|uniref:IclR family transcriptional regulator n=1 Tax=Sporosarcina sp. P13 TaxID=2048263 RepID=UPI00117B346A|nr:IclR family transcriptional regulator [Sporosarcina sp. P13]